MQVIPQGSGRDLERGIGEQILRPLQTLSNMLSGLREGDFSIRARVPPDPAANDALSLAYMEANALEEMLRDQRLGAVEASETLRKVLEAIEEVEARVADVTKDPQGTIHVAAPLGIGGHHGGRRGPRPTDRRSESRRVVRPGQVLDARTVR